MKEQNDNTPLTPVAFNNGEIIEPVKFEPAGPQSGRRFMKPRIGTIAVTLALAVCAGLAWFIVTGKAVYIETVPADARVEISGGMKLKLADRFLLRERDYQLSISAPGYHLLNQTLSVTGEQNQYFSLVLKRLPGHLKLDTSPAATAEIWLDETSMGLTTPARLSGIESGKYTLRLVADRFLPYESEIEIEGLDREQSLTAELVPAWGDISMASLPSGADVFVDDELVGQTPLTAEILQGEHNLRIKLAGHKDWRKAIRITANEGQTITDINLEPADAVVQIITDPGQANVTVDGEYKGLSPVEVALAPGTTATVRVFKQGYTQASSTVAVRSGDNRTLRIDLTAETAPVRILANPADASVYIDGKPAGNADQTIELSTTTHTIEIRKQGYVEYKTTITPRPGIAQQVMVDLKTEQEAKRELIKAVIQTPAGQTLKLFEAVSIVMGASRREPGRRANETIRNVQFTRPFYLSESEVTNAEFRKFDNSHSSGDIQGNNLNGDKQPVVNVSWEQAALYCNWLSEQASLSPFYRITDSKITGINPQADGYRLPTEAEWEWAARDQGGATPLRYPWGDTLPPPPRSGNFADVASAVILGNIVTDYNDGHIVSAPVAAFPANSKGLYDMGGNVAEWVNDFYDIAVPGETEVVVDPLGPETGEHHLIRGSSWAHGTVTELRLSFRDYSSEKRNDVGFRIARYME